MDECLVSVIIPVYHVDRRLLTECVKSVLSQGEENLEALLVFDGTAQMYEELLREAAFQDPRLRVIRREHQGVSAARNAGLEAARGTWVFFADADDRLEKGAVERLLKGADSETDIAAGDYQMKYPGKSLAHSYRDGIYCFGEENREEFLKDILNPQTGMGFCWGKLYRRARLAKGGVRFKEALSMAEDAEFVLNAALAARRSVYLPEPVYVYQVNPDSAVRRFREDYEAQFEKSMAAIGRTLRASGYGSRLKQAYETCVLYHFLLITVNYSFHPGQAAGTAQKIRAYKKLAEKPLYAEAIRRGDARQFSLSRRITVACIRLRQWRLVSAIAGVRHRQLKTGNVTNR